MTKKKARLLATEPLLSLNTCNRCVDLMCRGLQVRLFTIKPLFLHLNLSGEHIDVWGRWVFALHVLFVRFCALHVLFVRFC